MALKHDSLGPSSFPALCLPSSNNWTGVTFSFHNEYPDAAVGTPVVPLHLKNYTPPSRKIGVDTPGSAPKLTSSGTAYPNKAGVAGVVELPKITMEGYIDTPTIGEGEFRVPRIVLNQDAAGIASDPTSDEALLSGTGMRITWGQLILMLIDGDELTAWERVNPLWFRDPFGRIYSNPRIISFDASYVEQVPGRNTFNMTLKV